VGPLAILGAHMRRLLPFPLLVVSLALVAAGCGSGGEKDSDAASSRTPAATETGCQKVSQPAAKPEQQLPKPTLKLDAAKTYVATVSTSCGDFEIKLDVKRAPKTTASFVSLARSGFYDDTTFHRIVPGFVIQGGDPEGTGMGGPGYSVREAPPRDLGYVRGIVAMAKAGNEPAGASGSQFFVVTGEDAQLPPDYALVGKVTGGDDAVDAIATAATDPATDRPRDPIVIKAIKVAER
jgi:cyclophilin family peptidyl-prolyl cis-trans isomerase